MLILGGKEVEINHFKNYKIVSLKEKLVLDISNNPKDP
jgi:hypothetical protein